VWSTLLTNLNPVLGPARLNRQFCHDSTDSLHQVCRSFKLMRLLVRRKSFFGLTQFFQDLSLQLVSHGTGVLLEEIGGQVPAG